MVRLLTQPDILYPQPVIPCHIGESHCPHGMHGVRPAVRQHFRMDLHSPTLGVNHFPQMPYRVRLPANRDTCSRRPLISRLLGEIHPLQVTQYHPSLARLTLVSAGLRCVAFCRGTSPAVPHSLHQVAWQYASSPRPKMCAFGRQPSPAGTA